MEREAGSGREDNDVVSIPGAAETGRGIAQNPRSPASQIETLKLAIGKEGDRPIVRRPERQRTHCPCLAAVRSLPSRAAAATDVGRHRFQSRE